MYYVIWYDGWTEYVQSFWTEAKAKAFVDETGMDPDEFDIVKGTIFEM